MKLRNKLNYWRHQRLMEQKEFAELLGYSLSQYNRWENHNTQPSLETAWSIAKKLKIKIEDLFEETED